MDEEDIYILPRNYDEMLLHIRHDTKGILGIILEKHSEYTCGKDWSIARKICSLYFFEDQPENGC